MVAAAALLSAAVVAGCGSGGSGSSGGGSGSYTIYSITDLSGSNAANSGKTAPGVTAYIDMINKSGGVNGKKINLISLDSQTSSDGAVAAFQKAAQADPLTIITGSVSSETVTAAPAALRANIPVLAPGGLPDTWYYPPKPGVFGVSMSAYSCAVFALKQVQAMAKEAGIAKPKLAIAALVSAFGDSMIAAMNKLAPQYNMSIVASTRTPIDASSFSGPAAQIAAAHADYVVGEEVPAIVPAVMQGLQSAGVKAPFINFPIADTPQLYDAMKNPDYYAMRIANPPSDPKLTELASAAKAAGTSNQLTSQFYTLGWWAAEVAVDALKNCSGDCSHADYLKALTATKIDLAPEGFGTGQFSSGSNVMIKSAQAFHWTPAGIVSAGPVITDTSTTH